MVRLVARAWLDQAFREFLLTDADAAAESIGIVASNYASDPASAAKHGIGIDGATIASHPHGKTVLTAVENTPDTHNLIVCTLCSCYPAAILGFSPAWYKSRSYRARAVRDPRGLLRDSFGVMLSQDVTVRVHDSTADL